MCWKTRHKIRMERIPPLNYLYNLTRWHKIAISVDITRKSSESFHVCRRITWWCWWWWWRWSLSSQAARLLCYFLLQTLRYRTLSAHLTLEKLIFLSPERFQSTMRHVIPHPQDQNKPRRVISACSSNYQSPFTHAPSSHPFCQELFSSRCTDLPEVVPPTWIISVPGVNRMTALSSWRLLEMQRLNQ